MKQDLESIYKEEKAKAKLEADLGNMMAKMHLDAYNREFEADREHSLEMLALYKEMYGEEEALFRCIADGHYRFRVYNPPARATVIYTYC